MQTGFYISGVAAQMSQHRLNNISHNLANVNTTGFLASHSAFSTQLADKLPETTSSAYVKYNSHIKTQKGSIQQTGNDLDFAIQGDAFFRVALANGSEAYTRAGNFRLDGNGNLLSQGGRPVLAEGGNPIQLPPGRISANQEGTLFVDNIQVSKFGLVQIKDTSKIQKADNALLKTPAVNTAPAANDVNVHQGALESSNVNAILAMTELVDTMRSFQSTMKIVEQFNTQMGQLSDIGRIQG